MLGYCVTIQNRLYCIQVVEATKEYKMTKTHLTFSNGRLNFTYPGQCNRQDVCMDIMSSGLVDVFTNPEIGNAVPSKVWHGEIRRLTLNSIATQAEARAWYTENKKLIRRVVAGMDTEWNGANHVGTLTDDAKEALDALEYAAWGG